MSSVSPRVVGVLVVALALGSCGSITGNVDDSESSASTSSEPTTTTPSPTASPGPAPSAAEPPDEECFSDLVTAAVCSFVAGVQTGDPRGMDEMELAVASEVFGVMPSGSPRIGVCELTGDITTTCDVVVTGSTFCASVQPTEGEYDDGEMVLPEGVEQAYALVAWRPGPCPVL